MSKSMFSVYLPDRPLPIRIEADGFKYFGCELVLEKGEEIVARSSDRGFVVRSDLESSVNALAEPLSLSELVTGTKTNLAPVWPFLAGVALSALCAVIALLAKL